MFALDPDHRRCAWIDGDGRDGSARQCARPAILGRPYCPGHLRRAYRPRPDAPSRVFEIEVIPPSPAPRAALANPFE